VSEQSENILMTELYLISLLEKVETEMKHCRVFVTTKERIHPVGLELYDETHSEVKQSIEAYRAGKWNLHTMKKMGGE